MSPTGVGPWATGSLGRRAARGPLAAAAWLLVVLALGPAPGCSGDDVPRPVPLRAQVAPDVLRAALRPTDPAAQFHYDADSQVTSYAADGGRVRVHYATHGRHATILDDLDGNGVPDFVELVAGSAEQVLSFWADRGYLPPVAEAEPGVADDGGDGLFDIYLVDFGISADGNFAVDACTAGYPRRCAGSMIMENDFAEAGYPNLRQAVRILTSHELYHAIQAAYAADVSSVWSEATATWAEEEFDPAQQDFEGLLAGFFARPEHSLDTPLPGPVDSFSYGLAIFPRFLGERFGTDTVRQVWEELAQDAGPPPADGGGPAPAPAIDRVLQQQHQSSLLAAYAEFAVWNLFTGRRADPARSYADGHGYPQLTLEAQAALPWQGDFRLFHLASRYLSLEAGGRSEVAVALAGGAPGQLRLALLVEGADGSAGALAVGDAAAPPGTVLLLDARAAARVLVAASNVQVAGNSVRPTLCVGSPDEVAACLEAVSPGPDGGVAETDAGPPTDAGAAGDGGGTADAGETLDAGTAADAGAKADLGPTADVGAAGPDAGPLAGTAAGGSGNSGCALAGTAAAGPRWSRDLWLFALLPLLRPRRPTSRSEPAGGLER